MRLIRATLLILVYDSFYSTNKGKTEMLHLHCYDYVFAEIIVDT